jgi:hypothetical protein
MTARDLDVDLVGAAALLHHKYEWFRRSWRNMVREQDFPRPFVGGHPGGRPWWRAAAIEAWKDRQSGAPVAHAPADTDRSWSPPANDPRPRPIKPGNRTAKLLATAGAPR